MYILEIFNSKIPLLEHIKIIRFIRKTFLAILPRINCLKKIQVSMYGYKPDQKSSKIVPYSEENCKLFK